MALKITKEYVNALAGNNLEDKKAKVNYGDLQKIFEKNFPIYQLGYMVAYGAYGLVGSLK